MDATKNVSSIPDERQLSGVHLALWAGIVGPLLFVLVFTIDGLLTPGYSMMSDLVSYLERGPAGWIQGLNFVLTGLLFVVFAVGFFLRLRAKNSFVWLVITTILIVCSGLGLIMASLFLPDAPDTIHTSLQGKLHVIAFSLVFLPLGLASLLVGGQFIRRPGWRIHAVYSLISGVIPLFAAFGNLYSTFFAVNATNVTVSTTSSLLSVSGLINRVLIIVTFAWYVILAGHLLIEQRKK